jgi:aspartate/methionine/tyrosine aminotransferase
MKPMSELFAHSNIDLETLKQRAYNMRWAQQPDGVIPLTAADPDFKCAPEIVEAINAYSTKQVFSYGPAEGLPSFKEAIAAQWLEERKVSWSAGHILPVDSAAQGMFVIARACLQPGDEAIIFDPVDFLFRASVEHAGGVCRLLSIDPVTGKFDPDELNRLINPKTKLIGLCNPHNPIGKVYTRDELLQIGKIAVEHKLWIMNDEVWSDIIYKPVEFCSMASLDDEIWQRTITVYGFSKGYGLAGLRVGFIASPDQHIHQRVVRASGVNTTAFGVSTLSQVAAQAALQHAGYWKKSFVVHMQRMRDLAQAQLTGMKHVSCHVPHGCYVMFPSIKATGRTSVEIVDYLLAEARVAVVPGIEKWFGRNAEGHIRVCIATSEKILTEALGRMTEAFARLG